MTSRRTKIALGVVAGILAVVLAIGLGVGLYMKRRAVSYATVPGRDTTGNDIASYPTADEARAACSADPACLGYNSAGYTKMSYSSNYGTSDITTYVKQLASLPPATYTTLASRDVWGYDLMHGTVDEAKAFCDKTPACLGYNSEGYAKGRVDSARPVHDMDLFVKDPVVKA